MAQFMAYLFIVDPPRPPDQDVERTPRAMSFERLFQFWADPL
jgi:hypothetical protein